MNKKIVLSILFSVFLLNVSAQVTVGSDVVPIDGALLDIKQQTANPTTNVTATKGVVFPRVELTGKTSLAPLAADNATTKRSHIGTVVYNLRAVAATASVPALRVGLNVWDGEKWTFPKQSAPKFFYMPTFRLPIATTGNNRTFNLYTEYQRQFTYNSSTNPNFVSSNGATQVPGTYAANDLIFAVLDYNSTVIRVNSISAAGVLNYNVLSTTAPSLSYITVVCIVKD